MPWRVNIDKELYKDETRSPRITYGTNGITNIRWESTEDSSVWDMTIDATGAVVTTNVPTGLVDAPTLLDSNLYSPTNTCTSASITPTAGAMLVVICGGSSTAGTLAFSSTTLSNVGSWTGTTQVSDGNTKLRILWAKITGSAGTGTLTFTGFGSPGTTRAIMHVVEVPNGTAVAQEQTGTQTSATPSITLGSTPGANSLVIAAIAHNSAATAPTANFTELAEDNGNRGMQSQYDQASATTTVSWTSSNVGHTMAAVEIT